MTDDYWLLFNTNVCTWLVKMCYLYKFKKERKQKEYRVEFDYWARYRIEMNYYPESQKFVTVIFKNNKILTKLIFKDPVQWCQQLNDNENGHLKMFVVQSLYQNGIILR